MSFNSNKLNFKIDDISDEIIQPKLFLCDRKLNKKGEIYPFSNLRIKSVTVQMKYLLRFIKMLRYMVS